MRVLLIHNFYSNTGGEDIVYTNEVAALKERLGQENVFEYTASSKWIRPWRLITGSFFFSLKHYNNVAGLVKSHQIDVVHVHNFFPILSVSVFKAAKKAGAKVVHTVHNYRWWCISGEFYRAGAICILCTQKQHFLSGIRFKCYRKSLLQSVVAQFAFWYYKRIRIFDKIDVFLALTLFQQQKLVELGLDPKKIVVKPNLVETLTNQSDTRKGYLFVGRLEQSKGIEALLEAWSQLPEYFILTIVGTGSLEDELKQRYNQPNILFKGFRTQNETFAIMATSKYTIQTSLWYETFGLTIIESMRLGVPVIGFDIGTRPELIRHLETGFITTPEKLIDTIRSSYEYADYLKLSNNAGKFALGFTKKIVIEQQVNLYQKLISA